MFFISKRQKYYRLYETHLLKFLIRIILTLTSQTHKEKYYKGRTRVSFALEYSILSSFFEKNDYSVEF